MIGVGGQITLAVAGSLGESLDRFPTSQIRLHMLSIGVIGTGPEWETTWFPALASQTRLRMTGFYDPVAAQGERAMERIGATHFRSLRRMLDSQTYRGLLVLNSGWLQTWVLDQAVEHGLPTLAAPAAFGMEKLAAWIAPGDDGSLLQPELRRRYTPATMRVRELTATRLGAVEQVRVELATTEAALTSSLADAIDWCRFVMQSAVTGILRVDDQTGFRLQFKRLKDGEPIVGQIRCQQVEDLPPTPSPENFSAEIVCQKGAAFVRGSRQVRWMTDNDAEAEELLQDRSSAALQLDLFSRRLVGGLVPVGSLADVASAVGLAREALTPSE